MTTTPSAPDFPPRHSAVRHPSRGETTLYLIRHGRTASNVCGLLHGSTDVPLDAHGLRQAALIAARLATEAPVDALLASPLARALTTARIVGERIGREPIVVPGLVEMDFGTLEGATIEEVAAEHPELAVRLQDLTDDDLTFPGGESRRRFHARVRTTFEAILAEYAAHRVAVVAHGGVIGSFVAQIHGGMPNDYAAYLAANCSLTHLHVSPEHTTVHCFNDVVHLATLDDPVPAEGSTACD